MDISVGEFAQRRREVVFRISFTAVLILIVSEFLIIRNVSGSVPAAVIFVVVYVILGIILDAFSLYYARLVILGIKHAICLIPAFLLQLFATRSNPAKALLCETILIFVWLALIRFVFWFAIRPMRMILLYDTEQNRERANKFADDYKCIVDPICCRPIKDEDEICVTPECLAAVKKDIEYRDIELMMVCSDCFSDEYFMICTELGIFFMCEARLNVGRETFGLRKLEIAAGRYKN